MVEVEVEVEVVKKILVNDQQTDKHTNTPFYQDADKARLEAATVLVCKGIRS